MTLAPLFDTLRHHETLTLPSGWAQGRATYGGLVAALLYARLAACLGTPGVLRAATVSFVGPAVAGPATVQAEVLRRGTSVVQMEARLLQAGAVQAVMLASFGAPRPSTLSVTPPPAPAFPPPAQGRALPCLPGITPEFTQHFDFRWAHGDLPFTGSARAELGGWVRLKQPLARTGREYADLFLLADAWPPALLPRLSAPAPGSSLTWTLEPVQLPAGKPADRWWQYSASTDHARDGYGHCAAQLWDDEGRLVALSRQTVAVFA